MLEPADFSRNIGVITRHQQEQISSSRIAVCGVGGMGGVAAEALVRMGVGEILIADPDVFSASNVNRQIHCTQESMGQLKVDVVRQKLLSINPNLRITTCHAVDEVNVDAIAGSCEIVVNGMDSFRASLLLERAARKFRRPIVNSWVTPYASVFVMTPDAPHWEEFLELPTQGKAISQITFEEEIYSKRRVIEFTFAQFDPYEIVSHQLVEDVLMEQTPCPSLLPLVWLSGTLMANETMKLITGQGRLPTHWGVFYNQYTHEIKYLDEKGTCDRFTC